MARKIRKRVRPPMVHKLPYYGSHDNLCGTNMRCDTLRDFDWLQVTCKKCWKIKKVNPDGWV